MNCAPEQMAWIKVPADFQRYGVEQLNNRFVCTKSLVPDQPMPTWYIDPPQAVRMTGPVKDARGTQAKPGEVFVFLSIPDAWLIPMRGSSDINAPKPATMLQEQAQ